MIMKSQSWVYYSITNELLFTLNNNYFENDNLK